MKKILFAIAIVLTLGLTANAQSGKNDAFVTDWANSNNRDWSSSLDLILPTTFGSTGDVDTPLGSGLLVLTALGAGYAVAKKRKK